MADKITYVNKESLVTDPTIAEKNKVTDNNMNEIKSAVNTNADQLDETIVIGDENITNNSRGVINESEYIPYINSEIDNEYGIATNRGYSQEYINDLVINSIRTKNMFGNYPIINGWLDGNIIRVNRTGTERLAFIECKPNTTYTLSRTTKTSKFRIGSYASDIPVMTNSNVDYNLENYVKDDNATSITITSGANAKYLIVEYCQIGTDSLDTILASLKSMQLEEGSTATTFTKYQALNIDTFDTGWIDLSSYVNTTNFTIRPGYKPEARRIGNIVYLRGEIYCTTAPSGSTATLINNTMPSIFRPNVQYSNCGVTFERNKVYNIFISNAGIQVSQTTFETTGQYYGYQLSNLSGFIADD